MLLVIMLHFCRSVTANMSPDLELLAQQKSNSMFYLSSSDLYFSHPTPEDEVRTGLKHQNMPPQQSPFFYCECLPIQPQTRSYKRCIVNEYI